MATKNSSDTEIIFDKVVDEDLIVNNASVSVLREFITSWTKSAVREDTLRKFLRNWLAKVLRLHESNKLNKGSCLVTIFIIEESLNCVNLDQDSQFHILFSQLFIPLHKVIVSTCVTNIDEITSSNDAVIAFFRLHCSLSRTTMGLQLIRKYNLWKPLLSFYCKSNKFNFFIQNSCTEYIENLIGAELPNELTLFVEVINTCVHCIKNAIEKQYPLSDGVIFRSLRILQLIFSKYLFHLNENSLRLISKQCTSLESYVRHLLVLSKDNIIINYSLKTYILSRVFLSNTENVKNEDEVFRRFLAVAYELLNENKKFHHYMSEIFSLEFVYEKDQSKLRCCAAYLKMKTIGEYLTKLNIVSQELTKELDSLIPAESETFDNFLRLYLVQLSSQNKISAVALNILKNAHNERDSVDESTRSYFMRFYGLILKLTSNNANRSSEEINNLLLNVIYALSTLIMKEGGSLKEDEVISDLIKTVLRVSQPDLQYPMVLRLSAFKLCHLVLQKIEITSNETINLLTGSIIQGMNDLSWEIRDSALEVLNETLKGKKSSLLNEEICKSLLIKLEDEESFVRATAYVVLTATLPFRNESPLETYFDYNELLCDIERRFHDETEDNVRENMIEFIIEAWHSFRIPDPLLMTVYKTIYKASTNDLHSEVRRKGMLFWKNLVDLSKNDQTIRRSQNVSEYIEKLFFSGCCQAIINGIEDEYDEKVFEIASEALKILKSIDLTTIENNEPINETLEISYRRLINELPSSNLIESNFLNATLFISKYIGKESDYTIEWPTKKSEIDLSEIMKCFSSITIDGSEINQKDCY